jgi:hypothetical protein
MWSKIFKIAYKKIAAEEKRPGYEWGYLPRPGEKKQPAYELGYFPRPGEKKEDLGYGIYRPKEQQPKKR